MNSSAVGITIVFVLLIIAAWVGLALVPAFIAKKKGYGFAGFLLLSLFFSFVLGLVVSLCLPNRKEEMKQLMTAIIANRNNG